MKSMRSVLFLSIFTMTCFAASFVFSLFIPTEEQGQSFPQNIADSYLEELRPDGVDQMSRVWMKEQLSGVQGLRINSTSAHIRVVEGQSDDLHLEINGQLMSDEAYTWSIENGVLRISTREVGSLPSFRFSFFYFSSSIREIKVTLPKAWSASLDLGSVSGDIHFDGHSARSLKARTVSGRIKGKSFASDNTLSSVSGNIHLDLASSAVFLEMSTTSGNLYINLPRSELNTEINFSTVSGALRVNTPEAQTGRSQTYGEGKGRWSLRSVSGSVYVEPRS